MALLDKVTVKNFRSFRDKTTFSLAEGSYMVGVNNSGKSTVLSAIHAFFDDGILNDENFVNKTSFLSKKAGSNVVEIMIRFNLDALTTKKFKQDLIKTYGHSLSISKIISIATDTKIITNSYKLNTESVISDLPDDVLKLVRSVKVTYLHPQEGQALLKNAQQKLRQRLLANWGRGSNITQSIKNLQREWEGLRNKATSYLSGSLTDSLQKMWPESQVTINLPKDIRDVIAVSDINFSGYKNAPEIDLTSQGTGAQSTILYLTHYLLDSDRSLHRGEYHPVWLIEEPECFLHVDLLANLAKELNSKKWLSSIQMVVSTHSPVLLAGSRIAKEKIMWTVLHERSSLYSKLTTEYTDDEIKEIGNLMGDPNFFAYFLAAQDKPLIFIEDEKDLTREKYIDAGIDVAKGLGGVSEMVRFLQVFLAVPYVLSDKTYFVIDSDKGKDEFSRFYDPSKLEDSMGDFLKYKVLHSKNIYLVFLPAGFSAEQLYLEFDNHLEECISKVWDVTSWKIQNTIPTELSGVAAHVRRKGVASKRGAIALIRNHDDVKVSFWNKVAKFNYSIAQNHVSALKHLIA